jgi:hypothetical protein
VNSKALPLMSLDVTKGAMSDMGKQDSLHRDRLIFSELRYACNDCNEFSKVNKNPTVVHLFRKLLQLLGKVEEEKGLHHIDAALQHMLMK